MKYLALLLSLMISLAGNARQNPKGPYEVIAYFTGNAATLKQYPLHQLHQVIFSFLHLSADTLTFTTPEKRQRLREITALKQQYPHLKILVSLGGWGGCKECSPVFAKAESRRNFAASVVRILKDYNADGIDLDWEYPTIPGHPGHPYSPDDKNNFTELIKELRRQMGPAYQLSFAAGGFTQFLEEAVDWKAIMPLVNRVNLMTYDLVGGYSTRTGHHTPLYSCTGQKESTDHCVQWLLKHGVPAKKLVIGAAFYGRTWVGVDSANNGLFGSGTFNSFVGYRQFNTRLSADSGYLRHWDPQAQAPYLYNPAKKEFATYDDPQSIRLKAAYMKKHKLGGIMFGELTKDAPEGPLLPAIWEGIN